ncbi:hypothetical protein PHYBLDRAFT_62291 [Phycomyces blakesleeanus NRRL 1555(-)]|uniref:Uncharacterized protein n=1 Tax=Phycomyces blakesleeanus (strain ATCC 8743b / DSM 1359 / FGSC 10004 / NBRC 33097 / NRRL 1555) TaxID=763407 RepID=A0A167Q2I2_PHYB8|nr:hypothetical protein PHYBLDRAFT_62291 [Phycomyces blakesleeanus NRRL 1555(-)]OAD78948.1 hypothetical protein PHYBLDRAFT_62291 [Phycomyces blakesleeanus NRRL 1555(-)]|eukprot:XP_018296988.1 hypothetical protein PHYBLDRAFT_62291 [Phycomyces blakesleeanus NRRL 1555(-)]
MNKILMATEVFGIVISLVSQYWEKNFIFTFMWFKSAEITMGDPHSINNISPHKKQILEKNDSIYIKSTLYFALLVCRRFISMEYNPITEQVIFIIVKYDTEQRSNNNEISSIVSSSRFYFDFYPVFRLLAKSHVPRIHFILSN